MKYVVCCCVHKCLNSIRFLTPIILRIAEKLSENVFEYQGRKLKFLSRPNLWLFCGTCQGIADDATQLSCCGKLFCKNCLDLLRSSSPGSNCPLCRKKNYQHFEDPRSNGIIAKLKVMCPNGCAWQGELQKVPAHLDAANRTGLNPGGQRLFACPVQTIQCMYKNIGCTSRPMRKDMDQHLSDSLQHHLELTTRVLGDMQVRYNQLEETVKKQTTKIAEHETKLRDSEKMIMFLRQAAGIAPIILTVENIPKLNDCDKMWYSPSFFTHLHGYRMVIAIQFGKEYSGYSVYAHLVKGEFDDQQEWPFRGELKIEILSTEGQIVSEVNHMLQGKRVKEYGVKGDGEYIGDLYLTDGDDPSSQHLISDHCSFQVSLMFP